MLPLGRFALPALLAALVAAPLAVAAPASAVPTGSTATDDVVLYPHCQQHPITYDLAVDPGTAFWHLEVLLLDPDGHTSEQRVATSATSPAHGTVAYQFCGSEKAGTWTVRATGFYETLPLVQLPLDLPDTPFTVRPTETRRRRPGSSSPEASCAPSPTGSAASYGRPSSRPWAASDGGGSRARAERLWLTTAN